MLCQNVLAFDGGTDLGTRIADHRTSGNAKGVRALIDEMLELFSSYAKRLRMRITEAEIESIVQRCLFTAAVRADQTKSGQSNTDTQLGPIASFYCQASGYDPNSDPFRYL